MPRMISALFCLANVLLIVAVLPIASGCQSGTPKVETVKAPAPDPIKEAKTILNNYVNGMPVTSEAESFPDLIARAKEADPAKGDVLEKGLNEIKAHPANAKTKAQEMLKKL